MLQNLPETTGEMAQLVKSLPCKGEDLSFILRTHVTCPMCVLMSPAQESCRNADRWGSLASQSSLLDEFQVNERPCLK